MSQPLYQKIVDDLKKQIDSGNLKIDEQLPTEKELSEKYSVSRITSKRALTELEQAGMIYRMRGKGSFVKEMAVPVKTAKRILFLLPFVNNLSLGNFSEGLIPSMQQRNIDVMLTNDDFLDHRTAAELITEFDGLIYYTKNTDQHIELLFELHLRKFPVILLDKKVHDFDFPAILSDNLEGGRLATEFLVQAGHQKIGYIFGENKPPQSTRHRYFGYLSSLDSHQIAFHTSLEDRQAHVSKLLDYVEQHQLTAIVCENDLVAIESMRLLKQAQIDVPNQMNVIGFDNVQAAALVDPPLTTVSQDFKLIGKLAGEALIKWIETGKQPQDIAIPVALVQRDSTKMTREDKTND